MAAWPMPSVRPTHGTRFLSSSQSALPSSFSRHAPFRPAPVPSWRPKISPIRHSSPPHLTLSISCAHADPNTPPSSNRSGTSSQASSLRGSVSSRASVTGQPTPQPGGRSMGFPSPGDLLRKIASNIPSPRQSSQPPSPPSSSPQSPPSPASSTPGSGSASSPSPPAGLSSSELRPRSRSSSNSDLDPSKALPLPMTYPDSKPLPLEAVEDMLRCNPDTQDCKEVVFQWTGKCTRCYGSGSVTFRRKRGKDVSGKCISCHGIGYVQRITVRDDIRVMEDPDFPWPG